jgi:hypothetical protein
MAYFPHMWKASCEEILQAHRLFADFHGCNGSSDCLLEKVWCDQLFNLLIRRTRGQFQDYRPAVAAITFAAATDTRQLQAKEANGTFACPSRITKYECACME